MNEQFPYGNMTSMQAEAYRHVHEYSDNSETADSHQHALRGVTGPAIPTPNGSHYHCMRGISSWYPETAHYHCYCVNTGPAIPASNGLHVHVYQGQTTFNKGHLHDFNRTTLSVPTTGSLAV